MFYGTNYSLWFIVCFWATLTVVYGASLHLALKLARIELERVQEAVVILVSALTALVPVFGPLLACIVAIYLIYRMADTSLTTVVTVGVVTQAIAVLSARGILSLGTFK